MRLGPAVRKLLSEGGLEASSLRGTGPHGILLKGDVLNAMKGAPAKAGKSSVRKSAEVYASSKDTSKDTSSPAFDDLPNTQIRKIIAARLLASKNGTPHMYLSADATLDPTLALRKRLKEEHGVSISVNDFVIRATALALKVVPEANAFWDEESGAVVPNTSIDISVAVATEKGLITPIVRHADWKALSDISLEVKSLAEKARAGKLKPSEFQGGTFSISNLGMFSVDQFCAIINPPQACILAVGRGTKAVEWEEIVPGEGYPITVTKMGLTLSADSRVMNGDIGGRFLNALRNHLADPTKLLL